MTDLAALNFKSVVRTDPEASQLLFTSSHAVLYIFKENKWERAEIEGALMLYQRKRGDWGFVILNRLHANNFRELCADIEAYQLDDGLVMYSTLNEKIFGLWIYSEEEKGQFCSWLARVLHPARASSPMVAVVVPDESNGVNGNATGSKAPSNQQSRDLRTMLDQALNRNKMLDTLFASHHSSPMKPRDHTTRAANANDALIGRLLDQIDSQYDKRLPMNQFKQTALGLLEGDSEFWEDIYGTYVERRLAQRRSDKRHIS